MHEPPEVQLGAGLLGDPDRGPGLEVCEERGLVGLVTREAAVELVASNPGQVVLDKNSRIK